MNPVLHSSAVHTWQTPESFLERVRRVGPIALDPCTSADNPTDAINFFTERDDGLSLSWDVGNWYAKGGVCFVNPPYGRSLAAWADKILAEATLGAEIIVLVPSRTDTKWWQALHSESDDTLLWRGRLKFKGATAGAPFPSAVFYFGPNWERFQEVFEGKGVFV